MSKATISLTTDDLNLLHSGSSSSLTSDEFDTPRSDMSESPFPPIVILKRPQYYTVPSLETLESLKDDEGRCFVKGFTIGRVGYGNVCFPDVMDVANLNLDEIVHIRHREVVVYPDDANKPPKGQGLNRRAQVTLDGVYPVVSGETVKKMDDSLAAFFTESLRAVCDRKGMRFLEYRPDSGSFVFQVEHFSKYGLDNEDISVDTNKYKQRQMEELKRQKQQQEEKRGIDAEVDGTDYNNDVINGLSSISVPDIEMTDIITSSSDSKDHSDYEINGDRTLTSLNSVFDISRSHRAKELYLIESALNFDNVTELQKMSAAAEETIPPSTGVLQSSSKSASVLCIAPVPAQPKIPIIDLALIHSETFEVKAFYGMYHKKKGK